jgi:hypothetical protein
VVLGNSQTHETETGLRSGSFKFDKVEITVAVEFEILLCLSVASVPFTVFLISFFS